MAVSVRRMWGVLWLILFGALLLQGLCLAAEPDEDEAKWKKLEDINRARALFVAGDEANKQGDLRTAIRCWVSALELKPDSDYTRKCLATAREKLYKNYIAYAKKNKPSRDPLTAYTVLEPLLPLAPENADMRAKLAEIRAMLSPDQLKALESYKEALKLASQQGYASAREVLTKAQGLDSGAACLKDLARKVDSMARPGSAVASGSGLKLVFLGADWCSHCRAMKPRVHQAQSLFPGKFDLVEIDTKAQPEIADAYNVSGIPCMVFLRNNEEVKRIVGECSMEWFLKVLAALGVK